MSETRSSERAAYDEARSAFDRLETKDKLAFVVEATLTTLGRAAAAAGREFATVIDDLAAQGKEGSTAEERPDEPAAPPAGDSDAEST